MRYLNKVIFVNSASVKYAEIDLDGNTHFIGNQGAGKTALLRAILFFYNANKTKLGIGKEKKRFDDYYFEYQNSYIIYEINRDNQKYCVLAYKVNGKTAFRFIDAPYRRDFFIDKEGKAYESWDKIRLNVGKTAHYTKLVTNYEEYRKIIYGDNKDLKPEFRKYAIIESKQYQHIPRTIQNVFLNAKLEADFIKETIIKSISDEEFFIDLENYSKSHLRYFENQINDIRLWTEKNKKGQIIIRQLADKIIDKYRTLNFIRQEKNQAVKQLTYRLSYIDNEKGNWQNRRKEEFAQLEKIKIEIEKISELHKKQELKLASGLKLLQSKLKEAKEKKLEYESQNIFEIIEKVNQKESLIQEKKALEEEKHLLESQFAEINQKYEALIQQANNQKEKFKNEKDAELNKWRKDFADKKIQIVEKYSKLISEFKEQFQQKINEKREQIQGIKDEENRLKQQIIEIKHTKYFEEEIAGLTKQKEQISADIRRQKQEIENHNNQLSNIKREWELENKNIQQEHKQLVEYEQNAINTLQKEIDRINQKIDQSKNSLYAWLNENYEGWQENIGKVIDENVLYENGLQPEFTGSQNKTFFGIEINLNQLQRKVKTVAELKTQIKEINKKIVGHKEKINIIEQEKENELEKLKTKFRKKINEINEKISLNEYQIPVNKQKLKKIDLDLEELKNKAEATRTENLLAVEKVLEKLSVERGNIQKEIENEQEIEKRKIKKLNSDKDKEILQAQTELTQKEQNIKNEIEVRFSEINQRIQELQEQKNKELDQKGADTGRLQKIDDQLTAINKMLNFIEANIPLVIEYKKDKRELFDKTGEFKTEIEKIKNKLENLNRQYGERKQKWEEKQSQQQEIVDEINRILKEFETDIENFEKFKKSEIYTEIEPVFVTAGKLETNQTATEIIDNIKDKHYQYINHFNELKRNVNNFTGNFNENNIFNFNVNLKDDSEYLNFAIDLKEFIEEDKIAEYEKRINERFAHIVQLIARETTELVSKEAEIEKIIKKINADFVSKNFVKAIKEMEMRVRKSANPVVNLLLKIKDFNDENALELGETNLFTNSESSKKNQYAISLLKQLVKKLETYKHAGLSLSDSFDLEFRIVENDNDSGWVEKLSHVGSEGTDVLIKAIVNILLLNVFKENVSRKFKDFKLHCMMDEIGKLHPINVKGILRFANERNILLINSSPTSQNAMDYKYTYKLTKEQSKSDKKKHFTKVTRLIKVS